MGRDRERLYARFEAADNITGLEVFFYMGVGGLGGFATGAVLGSWLGMRRIGVRPSRRRAIALGLTLAGAYLFLRPLGFGMLPVALTPAVLVVLLAFRQRERLS